MTRKSKSPQAYIHGFSATEQERLLEQARMLEPNIFAKVDLTDCGKVLDLGCGVGAQSAIILKKWPAVLLTGVDASPEQLASAEKLLRAEIRARRFTLVQAEAASLPFKDESFDAIFICFVLEHLPHPADVLREARRVLKKGGRLYCTEVFNSGVYLYPHSPAVEKYWISFNAHQKEIGGDPDIGIKLPGLLTDAEFDVERFESVGPLMDRRMTSPAKRRRFMRIWHDLFCGPADLLCRRGTSDPDTVDTVRRRLLELGKNPEGIFFYAAFQAYAVRR